LLVRYSPHLFERYSLYFFEQKYSPRREQPKSGGKFGAISGESGISLMASISIVSWKSIHCFKMKNIPSFLKFGFPQIPALTNHIKTRTTYFLFKICKALRHCVSRTHGLLVLKRTR
jgi:hypothetical protein